MHYLEHADSVDATEDQVGEHQALAQPSEDLVGAEGGHEDEHVAVVNSHGEQGEHPYDEEVVWHQLVYLFKPYGLDTDAIQNLLV